MTKVLIIDFARVILFLKTDENIKSLNEHYKELKDKSKKLNPFNTFIINQKLLDYIDKKNKTGCTSYIFTSGYMHTDPNIKPLLTKYFTKMFTTKDIGFPKSFPKSFEIISNIVNVKPNEIIFLDDQIKNIQAAQTAGINAVQFTNNEETISKIEKIFINSN